MKLVLLHGRKCPHENLDAWGFDGPVLEGVKYVHATYITTFTVGFNSKEDADVAHKLTGWDYWDEAVLHMPFEEENVRTKGDQNNFSHYFGDWELQA